NEHFTCNRSDGVRESLAALQCCRDVQDHELVDSFSVVSPCQLGRVASASQPFEIDTLHDEAVTDVEAGDDAFGQHRIQPTSCMKLRRIRRPTSPDFSG